MKVILNFFNFSQNFLYFFLKNQSQKFSLKPVQIQLFSLIKKPKNFNTFKKKIKKCYIKHSKNNTKIMKKNSFHLFWCNFGLNICTQFHIFIEIEHSISISISCIEHLSDHIWINIFVNASPDK